VKAREKKKRLERKRDSDKKIQNEERGGGRVS